MKYQNKSFSVSGNDSNAYRENFPFKDTRPEHIIQQRVVEWLDFLYPGTLRTIAPEGMKLPISVAVKLKRMGYKSGTPDLIILEPRGGFHSLFVELKSARGSLSDNQRSFLAELNKRGFNTAVCFGAEEAQKAIKEYFEL